MMIVFYLFGIFPPTLLLEQRQKKVVFGGGKGRKIKTDPLNSVCINEIQENFYPAKKAVI